MILRLVEQACGLLAYQDQPSFVEVVRAMGTRTDLRDGARAAQLDTVPYGALRADHFFRTLLQKI